MTVEIERATLDVVEDVIAGRLDFLSQLRGIDRGGLGSEFVEQTATFVRGQTEAGAMISFIARRGREVKGVVSLMVRDVAPVPQETRSREGLVINLYVETAARSSGIGRRLLAACLDEARTIGLRRLCLYSTSDGRSLYESDGFEPNDAWMELNL